MTYYVYTHVSAVIVIRRFFKEAGIPLEVRSAAWDFRFRELLKGHIRELNISLYDPHLKASFAIRSPVEFQNKEKHWSIELAPELNLPFVPPLTGKVHLELHVPSHAELSYDLTSQKLYRPLPNIEIPKFQITGRFKTHPETNEALIKADRVKITRGESEISLQRVEIKSLLDFEKGFPTPVTANISLSVASASYLDPKLFFEEKTLKAALVAKFDGSKFELVDISVDKPISLKAKGSYHTETKQIMLDQFDLNANLEDLFEKRLAKWLEPLVPSLGRLKSRGQMKFHATGQGLLGASLETTGKLQVDAEKIELPKRDLYVDDLHLSMPLRYPDEADWGKFKIGALEFRSITLKKIAAQVRKSSDGIDLTTENEDGSDEPIRQFLWGGEIVISNLYAHIGDTIEVATAVKGGPFHLSNIQRDLCIAPSRPLQGVLKFDYPRLVQDKDSFHLLGQTKLELFNGTVQMGDVHLMLPTKGSAESPKLRFDIAWDDLDLASVGEWTQFGDMRGTLEGSLLNNRIALTPRGAYPLSYDFTIRGQQRAGKKIRFYGRAVKNILNLLGNKQEELPWYAGLALNISTMWRNWMPATADYMGFRAKTEGGWTEVTTFDPPELADAKKHYMLYGTAFTIPLNTHGVYPALMHTEAFHDWLNGMLDYFKGRMKNDHEANAKPQEQCTPPWE